MRSMFVSIALLIAFSMSVFSGPQKETKPLTPVGAPQRVTREEADARRDERRQARTLREDKDVAGRTQEQIDKKEVKKEEENVFRMAPETFEKITLELLNQEERSDDDNYRMLESGFSALTQFKGIEQSLGVYRMQRTMAMVMIELDAPNLAVLHAKECIKVKDANLTTVDMAYGFEILARSYAANGEKDRALRYIEFAEQTAERITDREEKSKFLEALEGGDWFGLSE